MAAEKGHDGKNGHESGLFGAHGLLTKAWYETLKAAGVAVGLMVFAPALLCTLGGIVVPTYVTASATAGVLGFRWAESLRSPKKGKSKADSGHH